MSAKYEHFFLFKCKIIQKMYTHTVFVLSERKQFLQRANKYYMNNLLH